MPFDHAAHRRLTRRRIQVQRAGRAGRLGPGLAIRLWSRDQHGQLPAHDTPDILAVDLSRLALELAVWGVADPASAATQARFGRLPIGNNTGALPLVATRTLSLLDGSETSVSTAGLVVPYGFTVDGRELQYDAVFGSQQPAAASLLANAPAKQVLLNGVDVSVGEGATVDLSGGGDLQAQEFIPGTGGTRDILASRFTAPGSSTPSSLFPDGREVYAILPGVSTAAGVYDPAIDARAEGALVGRSVHLSGVGDLPEGDYILLPARYATLPVQLIIPMRDRFVGPELYEGLSHWVNVLRRRAIDAGHWLLLSHPDKVATCIREWILEHPAGKPAAPAPAAKAGARTRNAAPKPAQPQPDTDRA